MRASPSILAPTSRPSQDASPAEIFDVELVVATMSVIDDEPVVRVVKSDTRCDGRLPSSAFHPGLGTSLDVAARDALEQGAGVSVGYLEQLQTSAVADNPRTNGAGSGALSIDYLALASGGQQGRWESWYRYLPWEDWRRGRPSLLADSIEPRLRAWAAREPAVDGAPSCSDRQTRVRIAFGLEDSRWDEEKVLDRFDLLADAGLIAEADGATDTPPEGLGFALDGDHRRRLARAVGRLRTRVKSCPLVFDLMPERFTLFELQRTVEAILGPHLHKQNFRRLVEHMGLVEPTEGIKTQTGGRPAKLFRFRPRVLVEHSQPGVRVRAGRGV